MDFIDQLAANISVFSAAVEMNSAILDKKGAAIISFGEDYRFCSMLHAYAGNQCDCSNVHCKGGLFAATLGDCYFYLCSAQLVHFSVAITEANRYIGSVLVGPILLSRMEQITMKEIMQRFRIAPEEKKALEESLEEIPLVEAQRTHYVGKLLFQIVCNLLSHDDLQITLERSRISRQQAEIGEFLQRIGDSGNPTEAQLKQERELAGCIFDNDINGAQQLLNSIIARIYFSTGNNVELAKIRMNELISVLARVVLQTSAASDDVYRIVTHFQRHSLDCPSLVELSQALADSLRFFIDLVRVAMTDKQSSVIKRSQQYIQTNLTERITVEDVARYVSLSPSYFSHLFKERTGVTFSAYVASCRIDQAKQPLRGSDISIAELAQNLGFENQQYFSRVFKKAVGVTPGRYRKEASFS